MFFDDGYDMFKQVAPSFVFGDGVNEPSVKYEDGTEYWMQNKQFHRIGGPALHFTSEGVIHDIYYIRGKQLSKKEYYRIMKILCLY